MALQGRHRVDGVAVAARADTTRNTHPQHTQVAFRARYELSPNEKAALEAPNVYEERGGDADAFFRALERADAAAADVRRALADPDGAKAEAQEHELVPAGDEGEALLAKLDGATAAAYRKLFEFAASSLGRGAATATDAAQKRPHRKPRRRTRGTRSSPRSRL